MLPEACVELVHPLRDHSEASGALGLGDPGLGEPGDRQEHIEAGPHTRDGVDTHKGETTKES